MEPQKKRFTNVTEVQNDCKLFWKLNVNKTMLCLAATTLKIINGIANLQHVFCFVADKPQIASLR